MPTAPGHPCPGCKQVIPRGVARCAACTETRDQAHGWHSRQGHQVTRLRGRALQKARQHLFRAEALCRLCRANGRYKPATVRDHIVPLAEGGTDDDANIQPLCRDCSDAKTRQEQQRGRRRS